MDDLKKDFKNEESILKPNGFFEAIENESNFVGFTYELDYNLSKVLTNDKWKLIVNGVPHGSFLVAMYNNELQKHSKECILLRVLGSAKIPQSSNIIESMIDTYIEQPVGRRNTDPDVYTKHLYQFSGLECRILGTFFIKDDKLVFGTDIENFLGAHKYRVYKPSKKELSMIVNSTKSDILEETELSIPFGKLRYASSSSYNLDNHDYAVEILLKPQDIIARRTAFFGMTRTGKSNTIKIVMGSIVELNKKFEVFNAKNNLKPNDEKYKKTIGQIVFDINGEYTFPNKQDRGSIYDKFSGNGNVVRYTISNKKADMYTDVKPIKYNFHNDATLDESFGMLCENIRQNMQPPQYLEAFMNISLTDKSFLDDEDLSDKEKEFYENQLRRKQVLYKCVLDEAGFKGDQKAKLKFVGTSSYKPAVPREGLTLAESKQWFKIFFETAPETLSSAKLPIFDNDMRVLMDMLLAKKGGGYRALFQFANLHSNKGEADFKKQIDEELRLGKIVLVDLSSASEESQKTYITKLCKYIFEKSMNKFTDDEVPEYIQMYFEEAHNIFPKDDKDLKGIYNRLAKEGAKLNLGISYSTQEVSSISPSILKNTQNWFISHLNNINEIASLEKYYDFADFSNSILRNSDVGYARIKTHSNNFIVPVQINKFEA